MPDEADWCCAAGICCDSARRRAALARMLTEKIGHAGPFTALEIADAVHDLFDLAPKPWGLGHFMRQLAQDAREYPYMGDRD